MLGSRDCLARLAVRLLALQWLWLCALTGVGCKLDEKTPPAGGLILSIDTDMSMPKDLDELRFDVAQGGGTVLEREQPLAQDREALPIELQLPIKADASLVAIHIVGLKEGVARVERSAVVAAPTSYLGYLRLMLNYLCDGQVSDTGGSSCGEGLTCVQGMCQSTTIAGALPDYYGRASEGSQTSDCFDVAMCMSSSTEITPEADCTFALTDPSTTDFNVALHLELGAEGVCTHSACWIVLDSDDGGFQLVDGRVQLPQSVCDKRAQGSNVRVALSSQCATKTQDKTVCRDATNDPSLVDDGTPVSVGMSRFTPVGDACAGGATRACAMCGSQHRMCQSGLWSTFSMCMDQGVCEPNKTEACGLGGARACGGDCSWGTCDNQPCDGPATRSCENCGTQHRTCTNGQWGEWSVCSSDGVCKPGDTQPCEGGGTRSCGGSCQWGVCSEQVCSGAASGACGKCGTQTRVCDAATATWSDWAACEGEGECVPDSTMPCGTNGTRTCGGNCQWDPACSGQMCEGPATQSCGVCGTQTRTCDMTSGEWSDWSPCFGEGECVPNDVRVCGTGGVQVCGGDCHWDETCSGQVCTGAYAQPCGDCGFQTRVCDSNTGTWSDWSACLGEGECTVGTNRSCGSGGTQTCLSTCRWDRACPGQTCTGPRQQSCGNCNRGTQTSTYCDSSTGNWRWGRCIGEPCTPDLAQRNPQSCGDNRQAFCDQNCNWGTCVCRKGYSDCSGDCVDLQSDENHCGTCSTKCVGGQQCINGECRCDKGQKLCDNACIDVQGTNGQHCGDCDVACNVPGASCMGGVCSCTSAAGVGKDYCPPTASLPGVCADLGRDRDNCGTCRNACKYDEICGGGMCRDACPLDHEWCNGDCCEIGKKCIDMQCGCPATAPTYCAEMHKCVNTSTDSHNCGACGVDCGADACSAGKCPLHCATTQEVCGAVCCAIGSCDKATESCCPVSTPSYCSDKQACVNLQSDPHNCGSCGMGCASGLCDAGKCAPVQPTCTSPDVRCGAGCCASSACDTSTQTCCVAPFSTYCLTAQVCVDLLNDPNHCGTCSTVCKSGVCDNGTCMPAGPSCTLPEMVCGQSCCLAASCNTSSQTCCAGSTSTYCGDACVDTQIDPSHCGTCGTVCKSGVCDNGTCMPEGPSCTLPQVACGQGCCLAASCNTSSKTCCTGSTSTYCGDACVDTQNDPAHCGGCDHPCESRSCKQGMCEPAQPTCTGSDKPCGQQCCPEASCNQSNQTCCTGSMNTYCGNACVDTQNDPAHCGGCDQPCEAHSCKQGVCEPAQPTCTGSDKPCGQQCCPEASCNTSSQTCCTGSASTYCGNACVDTQTDPGHCGGCDRPCESRSCKLGVCEPAQPTCTGSDVACGQQCCPGTSCNQSTQTCCTGGASTYCLNAGCVDTSQDNSNCGMCGRVCDSGSCSGGVCSGGEGGAGGL